MNKDNAIWSFFSSVKLALFTLCSLALTSILGTVIPQKENVDFYINKFGPKTAQFFQLFDIPDMYGSWWFLTLLALLCINLIVCSCDRFPGVWKQIMTDNLAIPLQRLGKMKTSSSFTTDLSINEITTKIPQLLANQGWTTANRNSENSELFFSQKGKWSRTGVYIVHSSILVIFLGAIYGHFTGFKGSIMLPELQSSDTIFTFENGNTIDLPFEVRCDRFDIEFYSNGMAKEYRSKLTILENGKEILHKDIEVNGPLTYKGITFYQSSYKGYQDFILGVTDESGQTRIFSSEFRKEIIWQDKDIHFGITNLESIRDRVVKVKIWFDDGEGTPSEFWMDAGSQVKIKREDTTYLFSAKQRYATGLQVAKDPGVWLVYLGCGLMLLGLYLAFFLSHRRIWVLVSTEKTEATILISGTANKNKVGFDKTFNDLADSLKNSI